MYKNLMAKVAVEFDCPYCDGEGDVVHPDWQIVAQEMNNNTPIADTGNWDDALRWLIIKNGYSNPPDYKVQCENCEGTGRLETWLDLIEAIRRLTEPD